MSAQVEEYKQAMRSFPASVSLIATGEAPNRTGLTATAVCSLTAQPPQIIVCLNEQTSTFNRIAALQNFSVNVLHTEQQALAERFGGYDATVLGERRFSEGDWQSGVLGVPVLKSATIALECELVSAMPAQTHYILIGAVKQVHQLSTQPTLLYGDGAFGQLSSLISA